MVLDKIELAEGRVYQLPTDLDDLYTGMEDIGVGPRYVRHYRKGEWHLELGGPKVEYSGFVYSELYNEPGKVVDGRVELVGPDINELPPETTLPFGLFVKLYSAWLPPEMGPLAEQMAYGGIIQLEGMMINGTRATSWLRISKAMAPKLSFLKIAQSVRASILNTVAVVEGVEIKWIIGSPEVGGRQKIEEMLKEIFPVWWAVDSKYLGVMEDDVDNFFGCTICRLIAPNHVCILTPEMMPFCGIFHYFAAEQYAIADPEGMVFNVPKGEVIDAQMGSSTGINEALLEKSGGMHKHFNMHSCIKYPTTNCGCMEAACFYIPEVDGIGLVNRRYPDLTPLGLPFSKIAGIMSGGIQNHGFKGTSVQSIRFPSFLKGDGGWNRIVWISKSMKEEVADSIPEEIFEKLATEEDTVDPQRLKEFLRQKQHPIVEKYWKDGEPVPIELPLPGEDWPD